MNMPKSRDIRAKMPSPKVILNAFLLVTVKVLNSYLFCNYSVGSIPRGVLACFLPKFRDMQAKMPSPKVLLNAFWLVTVKVLNSYTVFLLYLISIFRFLRFYACFMPVFLIFRILNSAQQKKNQREPATFPSAMLRITRPIPLTRPIRRTRIA